MRTARDLVLELYKDDHITKEETDLLLDAINQKGGTQFIPVPYENPNPYSPPYRPGDVWYTTNTNTTTSDNTNG